jgi:hypothetical protein
MKHLQDTLKISHAKDNLATFLDVLSSWDGNMQA